jgi:hypothetical protein
VAKAAARTLLEQEMLSDVIPRIDLACELAKAAEKATDVEHGDVPEGTPYERRPKAAQGADQREVLVLLKDLDRTSRWGGLTRVLDKSSGDWLWLCDEHRSELDPDLPKLPPPEASA